jgi:hypothetical protein
MPGASEYKRVTRQNQHSTVAGDLATPVAGAKGWLGNVWSPAGLSQWRLLAISAFLAGVIVALMYGPFSTTEDGDASIYDYIGQTILRGGLPYRDVVEIKAPGSIYLSALAMMLGKWVGIRDIISVRLLNVLLAGILSWAIFLVAWTYLRDRFAAAIAVLIPLMMGGSFTVMMNGGTQPKLPLMIFGLLSLFFIARNKPLWSGFCSMLACLCWQPGLLFTGVAFLVFSRYLRSWRDLRALKVLAGAAVPLAITLAYFQLRGALGDLWSWTITFNYSVFAPNYLKPIGWQMWHIWRVGRRVYRWDSVLVWASIAGLFWYSYLWVRRELRGHGLFQSRHIYNSALVIPPIVYFAFCLINFQGGPDLMPFLPFIGIFGGYFIIRVVRMIAGGNGLGRAGPGRWPAALRTRSIARSGQRLAAVAVIVVLGAIVLYRGAIYRTSGMTLNGQFKEADKLAAQLQPGDKVYVHGPVELLVLLGLSNMNPYVALDAGADDYIAATKPDGFASVIGEFEAQAPKVVAISRYGNVHHAKELMQWVNDHYDRWDAFTYAPVYIRRGAPSSAE